MRNAFLLATALATAAFVSLSATPVQAQDGASCPDTTGVQSVLNECAARDYWEADDALNAAWTEARAQAS